VLASALNRHRYRLDFVRLQVLNSMDYERALKRILSAQLGPGYPLEYFQPKAPLLGAIPELDSMAVAGILTAIEEELGVPIEDDEISADIFADFESLSIFVQRRVGLD